MVPLQQAAAAIRQIESSGNYSALGPIVTNGGRYDGDRAYGAYQVMGRNVPEWTQAALGRRMTPQEFIASTSAQDKVFAHQYRRNIERYGNAADAASVWHSGRPLSRAVAAGATDGFSTTQDYVARFNRLVNGEEQVSARAAAGATGGSSIGGQDEVGQIPVMPSASAAQRDSFINDMNDIGRLRQQADATSQRRNSIQTPQARRSNVASVQVIAGSTA